MKQELRIRYEWLQPSGRPQKPEWTRHVQSIELMQDETYVEDEGSKMQLASFEGTEAEAGFEVPAMSSDLVQDGDDEIFQWMSMKKDEDKVDFSRQLPVHTRHVVQWDKNLTQLQTPASASQRLANKRRKNALNNEAAEADLTTAKLEVDEVSGVFSKKQLLDMIVPVALSSKHKASKSEKTALEQRKAFSHIVKKVQKKEVKQANFWFLGAAANSE